MIANIMIFVYILKCRDGRYYTGITNNIDRRLKEHKNRECKFTRFNKIVKIQHIEIALNRKLARKKEVHIKRIGASKYLNRIKFNHYG